MPTARNKFGPLPMRASRKALRILRFALYSLIKLIPAFHFIGGYEGKQAPITLSVWFFQKVLGFNREAYWGVHFSSKVVQHQNIVVGCDSNPGIEPGCYIQGIGRLIIGDYTQIAANTSIITSNHDVYNLDAAVTGSVSIGSYCWIGTNCVVLPDVTLGDFTIVGAGAVVTKSFPEGHCIIAGNPARKIRDLDPALCVPKASPSPYVGYIRAQDFPQYRRDFLWI
jgi:acetyltransferase-like isoleucine patch superfamily enzyme